MWKMLKRAGVRLGVLVIRGVRLWMELLGQNPSLCRDPGIIAWQLLAERRRQRAAPPKLPPDPATSLLPAADSSAEPPAAEVSAEDPEAAGLPRRGGTRLLLLHGPAGSIGRIWLRQRRSDLRQLATLRQTASCVTARERRSIR